MRKLFIAVLPLLAMFSCTPDGVLMKNGESSYKIFVSEDAVQSEKYAAEQLQEYLFKTGGSRLEITNRITDENKMIYVGFKGAPAKLLEGLNRSEFGNEEYIIRSDGKSLLIAGGETRGTLYGVIGYLSDYLGCRWYTRDVTITPEISKILLTNIEDRQKPAFEYRDMNWRETKDTSWVIHNRVNGMRVGNDLGGNYITYPFVHTYYMLVSPEKYFASHPEYFSEVNGVRVGKDAQLCLTNPEVIRIATETVFEWIKANPDANVFSVDQNDGLGYCECESCRELDKKEGSQSGTVLSFVNQVAKEVGKVYPEVKLQTLAYAYSEKPPKNIRPEENVMIRLCHYEFCSSHPIDACEVNRPFYELLKEWEEIAHGRLTIWDYLTDFRNYQMPFANFGSFSHDVKNYADLGVVGLFNEGNAVGGGEFGELRSWVLAQLMWNPEQDAQKLIDEFVTGVYGVSSPYIAEYIRLIHDQINEETHLSMWAEPFDVDYLNPETVFKADSLFALAMNAASGDAELTERLELAYLPVLWMKLNSFSRGGTLFLKNKDLPEALKQFEKMRDKYHIRVTGAFQDDYGRTENFIDRIRQAEGTEFYHDWYVLGPFDNTEDSELSKNIPAGFGYDINAVYTEKSGKQLKWSKYIDETSGYMDMNRAFGYSEFVYGYAWRIIELPEAGTFRFGVGNNDGIKIWINGKQVFEKKGAALGPNQNFFTVNLQKGENTVLVKLDQLRHGWGFYLNRLLD